VTTTTSDLLNNIPLASRRRRDRSWDRAHPVFPYAIPLELTERGKLIRSFVYREAQEHMTTIGIVAGEFADWSLRKIRSGKLTITPRPNARRQKMSLTWVIPKPGDGEPVVKMTEQSAKPKIKRLFLGYRWSVDIDRQIKALAGKEVSPGEVVVFLLECAIKDYKNHEFRFREEIRKASQVVTAVPQ